MTFPHGFATVGCGFRTTMAHQTNVEKKRNGYKRFIVLPMGTAAMYFTLSTLHFPLYSPHLTLYSFPLTLSHHPSPFHLAVHQAAHQVPEAFAFNVRCLANAQQPIVNGRIAALLDSDKLIEPEGNEHSQQQNNIELKID